MLPTLILKNSGVSDEDYFKLHKIIFKLIINQMIFDTKSIAYDKNYSTKTEANSSLIKQFGQAIGASGNRKTYSLLSQLLVYQYAIEKNKQNPKNSDLLRLMILSKFSHSESLVNLRSVFKDNNKKEINEYLKLKNQIINSSISENKKQKDLKSLISKYIDLSIQNEDVYLKSNLKYVKRLFSFDSNIISLIQSNLDDDQLYLNYYHMEDLL